MNDKFKLQLDKRPDLQHLLFRRSFFVSKEAVGGMDKFPFYGNWNHIEGGGIISMFTRITVSILQNQNNAACSF